MRHLKRTTLGFIIFFFSSSALAEFIVVNDGSDFGYPRGRLIKDDEAIVVPAGQELSLLDGVGTASRVRGPFQGLVVQGPRKDNNLMATFMEILAPKATEAVGAVRGVRANRFSQRLIADTPSEIDVTRNGSVCIPVGTRPNLWAAPSGSDRVITITRLTNDQVSAISLPANHRSFDWPSAIMLAPGETYQIDITGVHAGARIDLKLIGKPIEISVAGALELHKQGCENQAISALQAIATKSALR